MTEVAQALRDKTTVSGVGLLLGEFLTRMAELVAKVKSAPRRPGVEEIRIPSERAYREREQRRKQGRVFDRQGCRLVKESKATAD